MRGKVKYLVGIVLGVAIGAGVAWAILSSIKTTATDTATAKSIGNVSIGNAETVGLFSSSLADITSGFTKSECTNAVLTSPAAGDVPKLWFSGAGGPLATSLNVDVSINNNLGAAPAAGNVPDCNLAPASNFTSVYSGTLANLLSTKGSYAHGILWRQPFNPTANYVQVKVTLSIPGTVDGNSIAGQSAAFAGNFENQGT